MLVCSNILLYTTNKLEVQSMLIFIWPIKYIKPKVAGQSQYIASVEKKK